MEAITNAVNSLTDKPIPNLLIIFGILLIIVAIIPGIATTFKLSSTANKVAVVVVGAVFVVLGFIIYPSNPLIRADTESKEANFSGTWTGDFTNTDFYNYQMSLIQTGSTIEGTTKTTKKNNPNEYTVIKVRGTVTNNTLRFEEYEIIESNPTDLACFIGGSLEYTEFNSTESMTGNWFALPNKPCPGSSGQIRLQKQK